MQLKVAIVRNTDNCWVGESLRTRPQTGRPSRGRHPTKKTDSIVKFMGNLWRVIVICSVLGAVGSAIDFFQVMTITLLT